jgi:hypothetical protein
VVDDLVEYRGLWLPPFVMLELLFLTLPCVSPEHTGVFGRWERKLCAGTGSVCSAVGIGSLKAASYEIGDLLRIGKPKKE